MFTIKRQAYQFIGTRSNIPLSIQPSQIQIWAFLLHICTYPWSNSNLIKDFWKFHINRVCKAPHAISKDDQREFTVKRTVWLSFYVSTVICILPVAYDCWYKFAFSSRATENRNWNTWNDLEKKKKKTRQHSLLTS